MVRPVPDETVSGEFQLHLNHATNTGNDEIKKITYAIQTKNSYKIFIKSNKMIRRMKNI